MNRYERTVEEAAKGNGQLKWPMRLGRRKKMFRRLFPIVGRGAFRLVILDKIIFKKFVPKWGRQMLIGLIRKIWKNT